MKTFKDAKGRSWEFEVTLGSVLRVKDSIGIDLLYLEDGVEVVDTPSGPRYRMVKFKNPRQAGDGEMLATKLVSDRGVLQDILFAFLKPQIGKNGSTEGDAWDGFDAATMRAMYDAFNEELSDFILVSSRTDLNRLLKAQGKLVAAQEKFADAVLAKLDEPEMMDKLISGAASGKSPEQLASILVHSPSGNLS